MRPIPWVLMVTLLVAASSWGDFAETLDGRVVEGRIVSVDDDAVTMETPDGPETLARGDVAVMTRGPRPARPIELMQLTGGIVLTTHGGDRLTVRKVLAEGSSVTLTSGLLGPIELSVADLRSIYLPTADQRPADIDAVCETMRVVAETSDQLLAVNDEETLLPIGGTFRMIDLSASRIDAVDGFVVFGWGNRDRDLPAEQVRLVLLAATGQPTDVNVAGRIACTDGSVLAFDQIAVADGAIELHSPVFGRLELSTEAVTAIHFLSDRVVYLADLEPTDATEHGQMDWTFSHRANASVAGRPIQLDGRTYDRGVGTHSFCELVYALDEEFAVFVATVGIDDAVRPNGDATLTILGDGEPLAEPLRLTGRDAAQLIRLDVEGVSELTIRVDLGEDQLDVADHVDLADARLIK